MRNRKLFSACISVILLGCIIRIAGISSELWIDEIWSLDIASRLQSAWSVFTIHHDNNHYLNTLYLYFVGSNMPYALYRIPTLLFGCGLLISVSLWGMKRNAVEGIILTVFIAMSFLLNHYVWEARGYTTMLFFGFLSFVCMEQFLQRQQKRYVLYFWLTSILAFLGHLTYLHLYLALVAWSAYVLLYRTQKLKQFVLLHCLPILCTILLYFIDIRWMVYGGADGQLTATDLFVQTIGKILGTPETSWIGLAIAIACIALVYIEFEDLMEEHKRDKLIFFFMILFGSPLFVVLAFQPPQLFVRHLLPCILFFLIFTSHILGKWLQQTRTKQLLAAGIISVYILGNTANISLALEHDRIRHMPVLDFLAQNTEGDIITIGSNFDFQTMLFLSFYVPRIKSEKDVTYVASDYIQNEQPEWYLVQSPRGGEFPASEISVEGLPYQRIDWTENPGMRWTVYWRQKTERNQR